MAPRNRLRRKRPVPQRNPGTTQNSVPNPTQSHPKGLPSCHRSGPALRGRTALPQHPYHSVVILTPLQIRIRYIYLFFFSLSSLVLPFTSNYLCHFDNLIRIITNTYSQSPQRLNDFAMFSFSVKFLLSSLYDCFFVCLSYFQLLSLHRSPALLHI